MSRQYDDHDETGRAYAVSEAAPGWLISERVALGELRCGLITQVRGGGFDYRDDDGRDRFAAFGRVYGVARPVDAPPAR